jgi:uncharacterized protein
VAERAVRIPVGDTALRGALYARPAPDRQPAFLVLTGWWPGQTLSVVAAFYARHLADRLGVVALAVGLRGLGSPGDVDTLTRQDHLADALAAFDFLAARPEVRADRMAIVGESFGGYLGCLAAGRRAVHGLALRVPTDFPDAGFATAPQEQPGGERSREWERQAHRPQDSRALRALHTFGGHVLLVESGADETVPVETAANYRAAAPPGRLAVEVMAASGHALTTAAELTGFADIVASWARTVGMA